MSILNGGSAFPQPTNNLSGQGMSLRQYYAGEAMSALAVGCAGFLGEKFSAYASGPCNTGLAKRSVALADALLAELNKEGESNVK